MYYCTAEPPISFWKIEGFLPNHKGLVFRIIAKCNLQEVEHRKSPVITSSPLDPRELMP